MFTCGLRGNRVLTGVSHHDEGGGAKQAAEKPVGAAILRSRRRRRISHGHENAQGEILRFAQNDTREAFFRSLFSPALPTAGRKAAERGEKFGLTPGDLVDDPTQAGERDGRLAEAQQIVELREFLHPESPPGT